MSETKIRDLGLLEQWSQTRHALAVYYAVGFLGKYSCEGRILDREVLYPALHEVIKQNPNLAVTIKDRDINHSFFQAVDTIDLDRIVEFKPEIPPAEFYPLISEHLSKPFEDLDTVVPWRLVVLNHENDSSTEVGFFFHHSIGDGSTGVEFHRSLQKALNGELQGIEVSNLVPVTSHSITPSLETLVELPVTIPYMLKVMFQMVTGIGETKNTWKGEVVQMPCYTETSCFELEPQVVDRLISMCRKEGTSITGLLTAVGGQSLRKSEKVLVSIPINLRRFIEGEQGMGVLVASAKDLIDGAENCWDLARQVKTTVNKRLEEGTKNLNSGLLRYVSDLDKFITKNFGKEREVGYEVSNVGVLKQTEGPWRLQRLQFVQSASGIGSAVQFSVASVQDGILSVSTNWQRGIISNQEGESITKEFERRLREL